MRVTFKKRISAPPIKSSATNAALRNLATIKQELTKPRKNVAGSEFELPGGEQTNKNFTFSIGGGPINTTPRTS